MNEQQYTCQTCFKPLHVEQIKEHIRQCLYLQSIKNDSASSEYRPYTK